MILEHHTSSKDNHHSYFTRCDGEDIGYQLGKNGKFIDFYSGDDMTNITPRYFSTKKLGFSYLSGFTFGFKNYAMAVQ